MPVDFSPAGYAHPYSPRGLRFLPWFFTWLVFGVAGAAIIILLWPKGTPTHGFLFWWYAVGIPNGVFLIVLGMARTACELQWWRACHWNNHRQTWIDARVREAQRPLQVLGAGYCLPLQGRQDLATALSATTSLIDAREPRVGSGRIAHNRFDEDNLSVIHVERASLNDPDGEAAQETEPEHTVVLKMMDAITPLVPSLRALSQYGPRYAPVVRVLVRPALTARRLAQVKDALRRLKLPELDCQIAAADGALMEADAWLDQRECRPLLLVAAEWHDETPPVGSTEGCVAVLLNPGCFQLPKPIEVAGILHRPVAGSTDALSDVFGNAMVWGNADASAMIHTWITGRGGQDETALLAAFRNASLPNLSKGDAQSRVDSIIGDAGPLNAWLSVAAAIESRQTGTHFIVDHAQAAVLHVLTTPHVESEH